MKFSHFYAFLWPLLLSLYSLIGFNDDEGDNEAMIMMLMKKMQENERKAIFTFFSVKIYFE